MELTLLPLATLDEEAEALFCRAGGAEASAAWFTALAETTLAPSETAVIAALRRGSELRAALPLVRTANGAMRGLTAPYSTVYGPVARSCDDAYCLGAGLRSAVCRRLDLNALDPGNPITAAFLAGLAKSGLVSTAFCHFANWYENVTTFEDFWAARPTRLRETIRRKGRKIEEIGGSFTTLRTPLEIRQGIAWYQEIYADSGKVPEPHPDFMARMIERLADQNDIRLGFLMARGQAVAAQLWLVRGGRGTIFKLAHRRDFAPYSPGTLLTHWMFSDLLARQEVARVDFGRGNDRYKPDWLRFCTFRRGVIACNPASFFGIRDIAIDILPTWAAVTLRGLAS